MDDLRAHSNEMVHEVETALEHLLEEETGAARLRGEHDQNRDEIGREHRPGAIRHGRNRVAEIVLHPLPSPHRHMESPLLGINRPLHAKAHEHFLEDIEHLGVNLRQGQFAPRDRGGGEIARPLDVVTTDTRFRAMQRLHTLDKNAIRARPGDLRTHRVQHRTEILYMRLAGGVVELGHTLRKHGGHQNVLGGGDARLVQQNASAREPARSLHGEDAAPCLDFGTQCGETLEMRIQTTMPNAIAPRRRKSHPPSARQQGSCEQHARTDLLREFRIQTGRLQLLRLNRRRARRTIKRNLGPEFSGTVEHTLDIGNRRHIPQHHWLGSQQSGRNHRQRRVLVAWHAVRSRDRLPSLYLEFSHRRHIILIFPLACHIEI